MPSGDRAAYRFNLGSYAEARLIPAAALHHLPDNIDARIAVAATVRGMTAQYLIRQIYKAGPDDTVLIHAAAGGMGTLLTQWAKHLGATRDRHSRESGEGGAGAGERVRPRH